MNGLAIRLATSNLRWSAAIFACPLLSPARPCGRQEPQGHAGIRNQVILPLSEDRTCLLCVTGDVFGAIGDVASTVASMLPCKLISVQHLHGVSGTLRSTRNNLPGGFHTSACLDGKIWGYDGCINHKPDTEAFDVWTPEPQGLRGFSIQF